MIYAVLAQDKASKYKCSEILEGPHPGQNVHYPYLYIMLHKTLHADET